MFCNNCEETSCDKGKVFLLTTYDEVKLILCKHCQSDFYDKEKFSDFMPQKKELLNKSFYRYLLDIDSDMEKLMQSLKFNLNKECPNFVENLVYDNIFESNRKKGICE